MRLIFGSASTSWPTARAHEAGAYQDGNAKYHPTPQETLTGMAQNWPTARREDGESAGNHPGATDSLTGAAGLWQTPGVDSFRSRGGDRKDEQGLDQQSRTWQTPTAGGYLTHNSGDMKHQCDLLPRQAAKWQTPTVSDGGGGPQDAASRQGAPSLPAPAMQTDGENGLPSGRVLSPRFVEMLMGWPSGLTDYTSSEMELCRWSRLMRGVLSQLGWDTEDSDA